MGGAAGTGRSGGDDACAGRCTNTEYCASDTCDGSGTREDNLRSCGGEGYANGCLTNSNAPQAIEKQPLPSKRGQTPF